MMGTPNQTASRRRFLRATAAGTAWLAWSGPLATRMAAQSPESRAATSRNDVAVLYARHRPPVAGIALAFRPRARIPLAGAAARIFPRRDIEQPGLRARGWRIPVRSSLVARLDQGPAHG